MNAPAAVRDLTEDDRLHLRVLAGRSEGARIRLPRNRVMTIGHGFECDVVLRDRSTKGVLLRLSTGERRASLEVVSGTACVLGRELGACERIIVEPYLPICIGTLQFAIGGQDEARWDDARLAAEESGAVDTATALDCAEPMAIAERLELRSQPARSRIGSFTIRPLWVGVAGLGLVTASFAAWFGAGMLDTRRTDPAVLSSELAQAGFQDLQVTTSDNGERLAIVGLVGTETDLARLREWASVNRPDTVVDAETLSGAAAAANDLLAGQNVAATARPQGAYGLVIDGPFLPNDRREELTGLIKRDLPRIRAVQFRASAQRGDQDLAYFFNAPGYGAASFVEGDPGYLVTEDGTRWFAGAVLPTGHKIVDIAADRMTVERDGLRDTLVM